MSNTEKFNKTSALSRRNFLLSTTKSLATLAVANTGVYIIGSAFKSLDGSMVAGAKTCTCYGCMSATCGYTGSDNSCGEFEIDIPGLGNCDELAAGGTCASVYLIDSCY
jgi:hypothetical protein